MSKHIKSLMISSIKDRVGVNRDFVLVDVSKLPAIDCNRLRNDLSSSGVMLLSVKNAIAKCALRDLGFIVKDDLFSGSISLLFGASDIVELSKTAVTLLARSQDVRLCGGLTPNAALTGSDVEAISKSPSRLELLGQLSTLILSPGRQLSACMLGMGAALASQVQSVSEKQ